MNFLLLLDSWDGYLGKVERMADKDGGDTTESSGKEGLDGGGLRSGLLNSLGLLGLCKVGHDVMEGGGEVEVKVKVKRKEEGRGGRREERAMRRVVEITKARRRKEENKNEEGNRVLSAPRNSSEPSFSCVIVRSPSFPLLSSVLI